MVANFADYEAMFEGIALKFPHRIMVYGWIGDNKSLSAYPEDLKTHRQQYFEAIGLLQETLGQFNPSIMVKISKDRSTTFIEVIAPQAIMEQMGMLN